MPNYDTTNLVFPQKSLPLPLLENLEEIQQKEAFLQELQNQIASKSKRNSSPVQISNPIPPSPLLPFLPYLQHPYTPPTWNIAPDKKPEPHLDTPLNLTKPKVDDSIKISSNDGNNNKPQSLEHAGTSKHLSTSSQRLPYDDSDFFAATCRLWPVMSQNLPVSMIHGSGIGSEMSESKQKSDDKTRLVRQQQGGSGRQRNSTERDLMGRS